MMTDIVPFEFSRKDMILIYILQGTLYSAKALYTI